MRKHGSIFLAFFYCRRKVKKKKSNPDVTIKIQKERLHINKYTYTYINLDLKIRYITHNYAVILFLYILKNCIYFILKTLETFKIDALAKYTTARFKVKSGIFKY